MITFITIRNLGANKHASDEYAITNVYIPVKNIQGQEVPICIRHKICLIEELKANMLVNIDIMTLEQFILDFNNKIDLLFKASSYSTISTYCRI